MRILITGSGMLGSALTIAARSRGHEVVTLSHRDLPLTDGAAVRQALSTARPELVFHTAALTKVNYCEDHPREAYAVNRDGTEHVAAVAHALGCQLVYFSTDYVFDGSKAEPWVELDQPKPLNVYGASKLAGEGIVLDYAGGNVVRTSGVFGRRSDGAAERNFLHAICPRLLARQSCQVVQDQFTALTSATALAEMVMLLPEKLPRLAHLVCGGVGSWYEWACLAARSIGADENLVQPIGAIDHPSPPRRPVNSVLASQYPDLQNLSCSYPVAPLVQKYCSSFVVNNM